MATSVPDLPAELGTRLRAAVQGVASVYRAAACSVAVLTPDGNQLRFVAAHGAGEVQITGVEVPAGTGIAGWVASSGSALAVADVHADPRFSTDTALATGYLPRTILAAPLLDGDEPVGVTEVLDPRARERDLELLGLVEMLLAAAIAAERPQTGAVREAADAVLGLGPGAADLAVALLGAAAAHGGGGGRA